MPRQPAVVTAFILDFEAALWCASLPNSRTSQLKAVSLQLGNLVQSAGGGTSKGLRGEMAPAQIHSVYLHTAHQHIRTSCVV